jgi:hypothetical protein
MPIDSAFDKILSPLNLVDAIFLTYSLVYLPIGNKTFSKLVPCRVEKINKNNCDNYIKKIVIHILLTGVLQRKYD